MKMKSYPRPTVIAMLLLAGGLMLLSCGAFAADWTEVCAPGRSDIGLFDLDAEGQAVEALTPFDGRLYVTLQAVSQGKPCPIIAYNPQNMELREETPTVSRRFGRMRVLDDHLYVPVAEPTGDAGGYYVSAGGGNWDWVPVTEGGAAFFDVVRFDGKTFLAGRRQDEALVAWRADGEDVWHIEELNAQATRFSYKASSFLCTPDHLALLVVRDVIGDWPLRVAPRDWGAWYVLSYRGERSPRGFLFDGPARPLPALRALAPATSLLQDPKVALARDVTWKKGLLAILLRDADLRPDPQGGLLFLSLYEGNPQVGRSFAGQRIEGQEHACDIAVADGRCAVLLSEMRVRPQAKIALSSDLEAWETVFTAELPSLPLSVAVLNKRYYIGLANGGILEVKNP